MHSITKPPAPLPILIKRDAMFYVDLAATLRLKPSFSLRIIARLFASLG